MDRTPRHAARGEESFMKQLILCAVVVASAAAPAATPAEDDGRSTVRVVGLQVVRPLPGDRQKQSFTGRRTGTALTIQVRRADRHFLGVDAGRSALETFRDDRGTSLIDEPTKLLRTWASGKVWTSPDGKDCLFEVLSPRTPARGARRVQLEAKVVLKCGRQAQVAEQPELRLVKGAELTAGPARMKIIGVQHGEKTAIFTLSTQDSVERVGRIEFLAPGGKAIHATLVEQSVVDFMGATYHDRTYRLESKKPARFHTVRARVHSFRKVERLAVPVKVTVGVGL